MTGTAVAYCGGTNLTDGARCNARSRARAARCAQKDRKMRERRGTGSVDRSIWCRYGMPLRPLLHRRAANQYGSTIKDIGRIAKSAITGFSPQSRHDRKRSQTSMKMLLSMSLRLLHPNAPKSGAPYPKLRKPDAVWEPCVGGPGAAPLRSPPQQTNTGFAGDPGPTAVWCWSEALLTPPLSLGARCAPRERTGLTHAAPTALPSGRW